MTMQPRPSAPVVDTNLPAREAQVVHADPTYDTVVAPAPATNPMNLAKRIVSLLFGIVVVLIVLRIVLLLVVANQSNAIVDFVYTVTEPLVAPFRGILSLDTVTPGGGSVFDVAALVALIGWALIYALIMAILRLGDRDRATA
jgi:YggT family protein